MKKSNKKYLIGLSLIIFLLIGFFLSKPIMSLFFPSNTPNVQTSYVDSVDNLYVGGGIDAYTKNADAIIIGEVKSVTEPYLPKNGSINILQDGQVEIKEVLKGGLNINSSVKITDLANNSEGFTIKNDISILKNYVGLLIPGEKVLLFLGKNSIGDYVIFAGPYGKYLIDGNGNVTGMGNFKMSLEELKTNIKNILSK